MSKIETVELVDQKGRRKIVNAGSEREAELRAEGWVGVEDGKKASKGGAKAGKA